MATAPRRPVAPLLAMPAPTRYDVRFRFLGIPVRVHPMFWLVVALLGGVGQPGVSMAQVAAWVACVFVSIVAHEYGHGLTAAAFGRRSSIALHAFGGLCASEAHRSRREELAVLVMGPGAGFLLFAAATGVAYAGFGVTAFEALALGLPGGGETARTGVLKLLAGGELALYVFYFLFQVNLLWGLLNLLPIWPLDGGRIAAIGLDALRPGGGRTIAHAASMATAGALGVLALVAGRWFVALFLAYFVFLNYQQGWGSDRARIA